VRICLINWGQDQFCFVENSPELRIAITTIQNQFNDAKARKQHDFQHPNNSFLDSLAWEDIEELTTTPVNLVQAICYCPASGSTFADFSE